VNVIAACVCAAAVGLLMWAFLVLAFWNPTAALLILVLTGLVALVWAAIARREDQR
jgi:undecaprenyl pyrophosphate phosphatase UppP